MLTVAEACTAFQHHCRIAKGLSGNTLRAYAQDLAEYEAFTGPGRLLTECDRDHLRAYLAFLMDRRALKPASAKRRIAARPFHRLDLQVRLPRRLPRALSCSEMKAMLATLRMPLPRPGRAARLSQPSFERLAAWAAVEILYATGMRVGELVGLRIDDLDQKDGTVRIIGSPPHEVLIAGTAGSIAP